MVNNRINWIDWAKCIAITMVVYGHIPQTEGSFLPFYICTFHIPLFYFISGYLTKTRLNTKEELSKCKHSLIIPYILYNIIFYPYWAIRLYIDQGIVFSLFDYIIKPIIGLFFLQINTSVSSSVNGAMWFIAVLLIMRLTIHICIHTSKPLLYIKIIASLFIGLFVITVYQKTPLPVTIEGLLKCMPLYLLGYLTKQYHWLEKISFQKDLTGTFILISISMGAALVYRDSDCFTYQIIAFYIVLITATYGTLLLCKVLNSITSSIIVNISIGTLMIMGLHWMFIGTTNYVLEHIFSMTTGITYSWTIAIIFAICIDAAIYPLILFAKKHLHVLLGK
jgi:fucose 4-O-acetylase-like acetyltransferase